MVLSVRADFDSGALAGADMVKDHIELKLPPYQFNDRKTGNWFYVEISGTAGQPFTISFHRDGIHLHGFNQQRSLMLSEDQVTWQAIIPFAEDEVSGTYRIEATSDTCWLALATPYPFARVAEYMKRWLGSPYGRPTASADELGRLAADDGHPWLTEVGSGVSGQVVPPLPLYALEVAAPTIHQSAPAVVIFGGNHAGEHLANYVIESLVNWWMGESDQAAQLRQRARLVVYPMVNPAGRYGGYVRGGPSFPMGDQNRVWSPDDHGQYPHVDRLKQALAQDVKGSVELFFDTHNTERANDTFMYVNTSMQFREDQQTLLPVLARMQQDIPDFRFQMTDSMRVAPSNTTCKSWAAAAEDGPHATYSYTLEPGSPSDQQEAYCRHYGETLGRGVADHFAQMGF